MGLSCVCLLFYLIRAVPVAVWYKVHVMLLYEAVCHSYVSYLYTCYKRNIFKVFK
jgi:hypothetical protein